MDSFVLLVSFILLVIVGMIFIHISVRAAGVENRSLKKSFPVALVGAVVMLLAGEIIFFSVVILFIAIMVLIRVFYLTTWVKAFVASIIYLVANWVFNYFLLNLV